MYMDVLLGFIALLGLVLLAVGVIVFLLRLIQNKPKRKAVFIAVTGVVIFLMVGFLSEPEENNTETATSDEESSSSSTEKDNDKSELKGKKSDEKQQGSISSTTTEETVSVNKSEDQLEQKEIKPITKTEFNERFELDSEEAQYEDGNFIFKDGSTATADYLQYKESDIFNYAMAIFENGELASIQIESKEGIGKDKVLEELVLQKKNVIIEQSEIGKKTGIYDIVINEKYKEGNVQRYPFELD